ncbi:MAG: hypothetical protein ABI286_07755 [Edaphobacter sp.]
MRLNIRSTLGTAAAYVVFLFLLLPVASSQTSDPVSAFFQRRSDHPPIDEREGWKLCTALGEKLGTMSHAEAAAEILSLDKAIETASDRQSRRCAVSILTIDISLREDGSELLVNQVPLLSTLLSDKDEVVRKGALFALARLGLTHPQLVVPLLKGVLVTPDAGVSIGPAAASALMFYASLDPEAVTAVINFLQRTDITADGRVIVIDGIAFSPVHTDALTQELMRNLDDTDTHVRVRALRAISDTGSKGIELARPKLERITTDPNESELIRSLAGKALKGPIGDDPEARGQGK